MLKWEQGEHDRFDFCGWQSTSSGRSLLMYPSFGLGHVGQIDAVRRRGVRWSTSDSLARFS